MNAPKLIGTYNSIRVFDSRNSHNLIGLQAGDVTINQTIDGIYTNRIVLDGSRANDLGIRGIDDDSDAQVAFEMAQADRLAAIMLRQAGPELQAARWNLEAVQ